MNERKMETTERKTKSKEEDRILLRPCGSGEREYMGPGKKERVEGDVGEEGREGREGEGRGAV